MVLLAQGLKGAVKISDIRAYEIGEKAESDIITPVTLVITEYDPPQTRGSEREPLVFVYDSNMVSEAEATLRATVSGMRRQFLDDLLTASKYPKLTSQQAQHPGFARFVTWFQSQHKEFPLTADLAETWATGESDDSWINGWSDALAESMSRRLVSNLPPSTTPIHLIAMDQRKAMHGTNLAEQLGPTVPASSVRTVTEARANVIRRFSQASLIGEFLARFVKENCVFDPSLTALAASSSAAAQTGATNSIVQYSYESGQTIVRRGEIIDRRAKAAIDLLRAKHEQARAEAFDKWSEAFDSIGLQLKGLFSTGISWSRSKWESEPGVILGIVTVLLATCWLVLRRKKPKQTVRVLTKINAYTAFLHPTRNETVFFPENSEPTPPLVLPERASWALPPASSQPSANVQAQLEEPKEVIDINWERRVQATERRAEELLGMVRAGLAPHLAKEMMSDLVRKLISDRAGLLRSQNIAALEIAQIEQRFAKVHTDLLERLEQYKARNDALEKELAARSEQNRQLINTQIQALQKKVQ